MRKLLRAERDKESGEAGGGGDFHVPFWADAKLHVIGARSLQAQTKFRVESSRQRRRLYPMLTQGFLNWLDGVRRSTNRAVGWKEASFHNHIEIADFDLEVKVDKLMALQIESDRYRIVYPYFSENPILAEQWARVGIWLMSEAFPNESPVDFEIVDILRSRGFRGAEVSLKGDEEFLFIQKFQTIIARWTELRPHYGLV